MLVKNPKCLLRRNWSSLVSAMSGAQARCHGYLYQASEREKRVKDHLWEGFVGQAHHSEVYITSVCMPQARAQSQGQI